MVRRAEIMHHAEKCDWHKTGLFPAGEQLKSFGRTIQVLKSHISKEQEELHYIQTSSQNTFPWNRGATFKLTRQKEEEKKGERATQTNLLANTPEKGN